MMHSQSPLTMTVEQLWAAGMEVQFVCEGTIAGRQTGNVCTPGTYLVRHGKLTTDTLSRALEKFLSLNEWVAGVVEVHGNDEVVHRINGVKVCGISIRNWTRAIPTRKSCRLSVLPCNSAPATSHCRVSAHLVPERKASRAQSVIGNEKNAKRWS